MSNAIRIRCVKCGHVLALDHRSIQERRAKAARPANRPVAPGAGRASADPAHGEVCPECGAPVQQSIEAVRTSGAALGEPERVRLRRGALLVAVVAAGAAVSMVAGPAWRALAIWWVGSGALAPMLLSGFLGIALMTMAVGAWLLARSWLVSGGLVTLAVILLLWAFSVGNPLQHGFFSQALAFGTALSPGLIGVLLIRTVPVARHVGLHGLLRNGRGLLAMATIAAIVTAIGTERLPAGRDVVALFALATLVLTAVTFFRMSRRLGRAVALAE